MDQANPRKLYVGNLPWSIDTAKLREIFAEFGEITDATVISDKYSGRSKGFGFVEYGSEESAQKAIKAMNEKEVEGRNIVVNVAKPPQQN